MCRDLSAGSTEGRSKYSWMGDVSALNTRNKQRINAISERIFEKFETQNNRINEKSLVTGKIGIRKFVLNGRRSHVK
jgi:hypothetical protein